MGQCSPVVKKPSQSQWKFFRVTHDLAINGLDVISAPQVIRLQKNPKMDKTTPYDNCKRDKGNTTEKYFPRLCALKARHNTTIDSLGPCFKFSLQVAR